MATQDFTRLPGSDPNSEEREYEAGGIVEEGAEYTSRAQQVARALGTPGEEQETEEPTHTQSEATRTYRRTYESQGTPFEKPKTLAFSIVSLVFSILSLVCCISGFISATFGIIAIVFAIVSRAHLGYFDAMSIIGLILGIIGAVFGLFLGIISIVGIFAESGTIFEEILGPGSDINIQA